MNVILGTAHLITTPGKRSPDGTLRECEYSREIVKLIKQKLENKGITAIIDYETLEPNAQMKGSTAKQEQSRELVWRVKFVNNLCSKYGTNNCIYVSVHVNAAGMGDKWLNARGWSVYTSPGKTKSDELATCLYNEAKKILANDTKMRADFTDGDPDYESKLYVLTKTKCPAVLTENLFQDNKEDVEFLLNNKEKIADIHVQGILKYLNK